MKLNARLALRSSGLNEGSFESTVGKMKILMVGHEDGVNLESSYSRAFQSLGHEVEIFALESHIQSYIRLGKVGRLIQRFNPIETWVRKGNRELVTFVLGGEVDLLVVIGSAPVHVGALAQIRAATSTYAAWIWPDTLVNLAEQSPATIPLYQTIFSYSSEAAKVFESMGASVIWLPLAGDPELHFPGDLNEDEIKKYKADITFIGGWRPEREAALSSLSNYDLKIWGPEWGRRCTTEKVRSLWQGRALLGSDFAKAIAASRINLNIIDPINFPAANMRFFEILAAGGLQVSSTCPEMESVFVNGEHLFYYRSEKDLPAQIDQLLRDEELCRRVAKRGHELLMSAHTYTHRARAICDVVSNTKNRAIA